MLKNSPVQNKSLRLNVFKECGNIEQRSNLWKIKHDMKWIDNCPLPKDEEFKKLILFK